MSDNRIDVIFGAKIADLLSGMREASSATKESVEGMKRQMEGLRGTVEGVSAVFAGFASLMAGGEFFKEMIADTMEAGEHLKIVAQQTGLAVEEISRLDYAATMSDVSVEALDAGLTRLARSMEDAQKGSGPAADTLRELGVRATDAEGHLRPMRDVLLYVADRFQHMQNGANKTAAALSLFGRSGATLIPLLNEGREGISKWADEADRLAITMSEADVEAAQRLDDALKTFHATVGSLKRRLAEELMPALTDIANGMTTFAGRADDAGHRGGFFGDALKFIAKAALELYAALNALVQGAVFLKVVLTTKVGEGWIDTVTAAMHKMGDAVTKVNDQVLNAMLRINGFGGERGAKPTSAAGSGDTVVDATGTSPLDRMQLEWLAIKEGQKNNFGDLSAMELKFWQDRIDLVDKGSKDYLQIRARIVALEQQAAKTGYEGQMAALQAQEELDKDRLQDLLADRQEELALIRQHYTEESKEVQDGIRRVNEVTAQMQREGAKQWEDTFNAFPAAFSKAAQGIGKDIFTLRDLFRTFFDDLTQMAIAAGAKSLSHHVATELAKKNITLASVSARVAAESWGAIQSVALGAWAALKNIANYAAQAIAAAWAAISAIPVVGPFLAPAVAVGTGALVLGLAGQIKSAQGGYDVPAGVNPMTQLHAQEMVLPAELANTIRGMARGGGGGGQTIHLHVSAVDANGVRRFFLDNHSEVAAAVAKAIDMNSTPLTRALRNRGA